MSEDRCARCREPIEAGKTYFQFDDDTNLCKTCFVNMDAEDACYLFSLDASDIFDLVGYAEKTMEEETNKPAPPIPGQLMLMDDLSLSEYKQEAAV